MNARSRWKMGWILVATLGCGTRSTLSATDAAVKKDGVGGPDTLLVPDAFDVATGSPDQASFPDVDSRGDAWTVLSPDLSALDMPPDHGVFDGSSGADAADAFASEVDTVGDGPARDAAAERVPTDAISPDVAYSEVASDALLSSIDGALAAFCSGDTPHMVVNGIDSHPAVSGHMIPYDCCDGGEFKIVTATFVDLIIVSWQAQAGATSVFPATIDLASPPKGWNVRITIGCDTATASCNPAPDSYTSGLQGVLQVSRASSGFDMSLCLHVQEPTGSPHPIVHTLDVFAPHIKSN